MEESPREQSRRNFTSMNVGNAIDISVAIVGGTGVLIVDQRTGGTRAT